MKMEADGSKKILTFFRNEYIKPTKLQNYEADGARHVLYRRVSDLALDILCQATRYVGKKNKNFYFDEFLREPALIFVTGC
jgi:hypothetical protein